MKRHLLAAMLFALPASAQPKPFAEVVTGATEIPGYFTLYQKDEKVWLAIKPDQLDKPFFFSYNVPQSVGENGLYGGMMGGSDLAVFHKVGNQIQLIAKNDRFFAQPGTPQAQVVANSFSDSLLASATAASAADPQKGILVEANSLLFTDIPFYLTRLESVYRMNFALDKTNSSIDKVNNDAKLTGLKVKVHYNVAKLNAPPLVPSAVPQPAVPGTPDPRSLFVSFYYNFRPLGEQAMLPRKADERIGHFVTSRTDFTEDNTPNPKVHYVNRWRLEKKDPAAALSEPLEPIVYWLDKDIPEKYRAAVTGGILEWNKAFERIGFKDAIVVKQQAAGDSWDTMDARHASVRWFTAIDAGFAIGPSQVDPRTGEILDADIGMCDVFSRSARRTLVEDTACSYDQEKGNEMEFAVDLLEARGLDMSGPQAEALAQAYVFDVIMHEVGHTLGLRHNFRASTAYSLKDLQNPAFTRKNGMAASVMDYIPFNLATQGERQGEYVMSTLGPYDYLAIEYAYKPGASDAELEAIAARSTTDPALSYATDEDSMQLGDPGVNRFDMGGDPIEYYVKRLQLTRELWDRISRLPVHSGEGYQRLTRSYSAGLGQIRTVAPLVAKYVGGVTQRRDRAGTSHATFEPTATARQREALRLITDNLLRPDSFAIEPALAARLAPDFFERRGSGPPSLQGTVLGIQRSVLDVLMSDALAQRMLDSQDLTTGQAFRLSEVYDTLQASIWNELHTGADISTMRRNLQRDHLRRLVAGLVRPSPATPPDARSLLRENALALAKELKATAGKPRSREAKAHLNEALDTLSQALKAGMDRSG